MPGKILHLFRYSSLVKVSTFFLLILTIWWGSIFFRGLHEGTENNIFTLLYPWLSLLGGIWGLLIAKQWGGWHSIIGRSLVVLSWGLLAQFFGQFVYAYYIYILGVEVPYPSLGDVGYFGSVLLYIYGALLIGKAAGIKITVSSYQGKALTVFLPLSILICSYLVFLQGYEFDWSQPLRVLLDFGYPLGQALYVSIALVAYVHSRKVVGGIMKWPITLLIAALVVQYLSDFTFLYQVSREQWYVGGINDYMYLVSYFLMTLSLAQIGMTYKQIKES